MSKIKKDLNSNISRKEAIGKMGKYAALTAVGTFLILNPQKAQAQSLATGSADNPFTDIDN